MIYSGRKAESNFSPLDVYQSKVFQFGSLTELMQPK